MRRNEARKTINEMIEMLREVRSDLSNGAGSEKISDNAAKALEEMFDDVISLHAEEMFDDVISLHAKSNTL